MVSSMKTLEELGAGKFTSPRHVCLGREVGAMYCEAPRIRRVREGRGILLKRMIYLRASFRAADAEPVTRYSLQYVSGKFLSPIP